MHSCIGAVRKASPQSPEATDTCCLHAYIHTYFGAHIQSRAPEKCLNRNVAEYALREAGQC